MKLSGLTNLNKNLERKMRFFVDYLHFVNEHLGKLPDLGFDNPLSLIDKIIFQIETNPNQSRAYINNHFNNLLEFYKNPRFSNFETFNNVKGSITQYLGSMQTITTWLPDHPELLTSVYSLKAEYEKTLFSEIISALFTFMQCPHELTTHKEDIKFCTQILVSLYRFRNYSQESIDKFTSRLLSKDINVFPLPLQFITADKTESLRKMAEDFIKQNDFKQQFDGFKNLFETIEVQTGYFIYTIDNCRFADDLKETFKLTFNKVTFITPFHQELKVLDEILKIHDNKFPLNPIYPKFFSDNKLLAFTILNYEDPMDRQQAAIEIINEELHQLNQYVDTNLVLNRSNFLFAENFNGGEWNVNANFKDAVAFRFDNLHYESANNNVFERLRNITSTAKEPILSNERIFLKAFTNETSFYWSYLESLFFGLSLKPDDIQKKSVKILLNELPFLANKFLKNIVWTLSYWNASEEISGLNYDESRKMHNEIVVKNNLEFDLTTYRAKVQNDFIQDAFYYYDNFTSDKQKYKWQKYLRSLMLELYEYRNSEFHSGRVNEYSKIKLKALLSYFITQIRWAFIHGCENNPELSFEQLLIYISSPTAED